MKETNNKTPGLARQDTAVLPHLLSSAEPEDPLQELLNSILIPSGNIRVSTTGNTQIPAGNARGPAGNTQVLAGNERGSADNTQILAGNAGISGGDAHAAAGDTQILTANTQLQAEDAQTTKGDTQILTGITQDTHQIDTEELEISALDAEDYIEPEGSAVQSAAGTELPSAASDTNPGSDHNKENSATSRSDRNTERTVKPGTDRNTERTVKPGTDYNTERSANSSADYSTKHIQDPTGEHRKRTRKIKRKVRKGSQRAFTTDDLFSMGADDENFNTGDFYPGTDAAPHRHKKVSEERPLTQSNYLEYLSRLRRADSELALAKAESAELVRLMDNYKDHYRQYEKLIQTLMQENNLMVVHQLNSLKSAARKLKRSSDALDMHIDSEIQRLSSTLSQAIEENVSTTCTKEFRKIRKSANILSQCSEEIQKQQNSRTITERIKFVMLLLTGISSPIILILMLLSMF